MIRQTEDQGTEKWNHPPFARNVKNNITCKRVTEGKLIYINRGNEPFKVIYVLQFTKKQNEQYIDTLYFHSNIVFTYGVINKKNTLKNGSNDMPGAQTIA